MPSYGHLLPHSPFQLLQVQLPMSPLPQEDLPTSYLWQERLHRRVLPSAYPTATGVPHL